MLTFYDAFHGIGGFRYGLESAGMKCVGGCEIDKYACQAYGVINDERCEPTDIRDVDAGRLPDFDTLVFGWPCQDNSIAGKRNGQREGTRSGLLFEAARILRAKKPKYFIAENVEGLFSVNDGIDFYQTIRLFTDLGYDCQWQVLNTRWFLPQNRERLFFVGHARGQSRPEIFPFGTDQKENGDLPGLQDCINCLTARYYGSQAVGSYVVESEQYAKIYQRPRGNNHGGVHSVAPTITSSRWEQNHFLLYQQVRRLTPLECFRLQGYPDEWLYKCKEAGISDAQLYKMAGNGVSSPVAQEIGRRLLVSSIEPTEISSPERAEAE